MFTKSTLLGLSACLFLAAAGFAKEPAKRTFQLSYGATLKELPTGAKVRVWIPIPQDNEHQTVKVVSKQIPGEAQAAKDETYGNEILYFESQKAESVDFQMTYEITRHEVLGLEEPGGQKLTAKEKKLFLSANEMVPLGGKPGELIANLALSDDPIEAGKQLYMRTDDHMEYDKSRPGYGKGDAVWACDSRFGNCTDFHSLFISWARTLGLPARFEIGFPLPPERGEGKIGGYHCWAQFYADGHGWVPVDISEADKQPDMKEYYYGNLTENRVTFSQGRDIDLVPQQEGPPLNFFVYPYVEVDGKPWPKEKIELAFSYADKK